MKIKKYLPLNTYWLILILIVLLGTVACKKKNKDPKPAIITVTHLNLMLDSVKKGRADADATLRDMAGILGKTATAPILLDANNSYTGTLLLEDETKNPKAVITSEYTVTYQVTGVPVTASGPAATPTFTTQNAGSGFLVITLTKGNQSGTITFPLTVRQ